MLWWLPGRPCGHWCFSARQPLASLMASWQPSWCGLICPSNIIKSVVHMLVSVLLALTHWGWVMHICVSKPIIIGSDNGLSPGRHQAIIGTNAEILLIGPLGTNISEILIKVHTFHSKNAFKMSGNWRPFSLDLNVFSHAVNIHVCTSHKLMIGSQLFVYNPFRI